MLPCGMGDKEGHETADRRRLIGGTRAIYQKRGTRDLHRPIG